MHNFAASTYDRASVMDYPHPYIVQKKSGKFDFADAYDTGIGAWDIKAIQYGYQVFADPAQTQSAVGPATKR